MKITIKEQHNGAWRLIPLNSLQDCISAMSGTDRPIVAKLEEVGDTRYYSNSEEQRRILAKKYGEEAISDMPTAQQLKALQDLADLNLGIGELESLIIPPSDF